MKKNIFILFFGLVAISFSFSADADQTSLFVAISQRCNYCDPVAKISVVAILKPADWYGYGLVAQNTENVYRWHSGEALTELWKMPYGLYFCTGDFLLQESNQQRDLFVRRLDFCRKAAPNEQYDFDNKYRGGTSGH